MISSCEHPLPTNFYFSKMIPYLLGLIQNYQLLVLQEGGIRHVPVLQYGSKYTLEILGRGNQPQGWEIPVLPTI